MGFWQNHTAHSHSEQEDPAIYLNTGFLLKQLKSWVDGHLMQFILISIKSVLLPFFRQSISFGGCLDPWGLVSEGRLSNTTSDTSQFHGPA